MEKIVVYERNNLLDALGNKGVTKAKGGVRIYNQKYYTTHCDVDSLPRLFYLKKVICF